jgi:hypothetical protein
MGTLKQIFALSIAKQWFNQHRLPERSDDVKAEHVIKAIEIALAEQSAEPESEYITAEQARKLGTGNSEWFDAEDGNWFYCEKATDYFPRGHIERKYRAIKQAQPEPVKEYDEAAFLKQFETNLKRDREEFFRVTEPVDPHAALRAEYAKQLAEGTTGFYLWEFKNKYMTKFAGVSECSDWDEFHPMLEYRCTDIRTA